MGKQMTTPLYIEIGLHYYTRADEFEHLDAPACVEAIGEFVEAGLLKPTPDGRRKYEPTDGMRAWARALCAVPFPHQQWIVPTELKTPLYAQDMPKLWPA
jgi:hypothetical protein